MFELLASFLRASVAWLPRLDLVRKTHAAVKFSRGGATRLVPPGLYWYWPLTTEVEQIVTAERAWNLETQTIAPTTGQPIGVSAVLTCTVTDPLKALTRAYDLDEIIPNVGLAAVLESIVGASTKALRERLISGALTNDLSRVARKRLKPYGVQVTRLALTDFAPVRTLMHMGSTPVSFPEA